MAASDADGRKNRRESDFRHTCGLCMEPYSGRNPKILPCFHTFCLPCLTSLANLNVNQATEGSQATKKEAAETTAKHTSAEVGEESTVTVNLEEVDGEKPSKMEKSVAEGEEEKKVDVILCPTCRAPVTIPAKGVTALQTNFYLEDESTEGDLPPPATKPPPCDMCEEGEESQEAAYTCDKCRQRMCRTCRRLHDKFTDPREHHVRDLNIHDQSSWLTPAPVRRCSTHPGQDLCFHCQKCDVSICLHCKLTSHEGHVTEDVATAAVRAKEEIATVLSEANKQLRSVEAAVGRLERDEVELSRQKEELTRQANARYDVIVTWAARARDEFLEALTAKSRTSLNDIRSEKAAARVTMETLSRAVSRASRGQSGLGPDTVLAKNELQAALLGKDVLDRYTQLEGRKDSLTFFTCEADGEAVDLDTLRSYIGVLTEEDGATLEKRPTVSLRELATSVANLESALDTVTGKLQRSQVSFHARMNSGGTFCAANQTLIFNNAVTNEGGGYDPTSGVFTAPESGTYLFIVTVRPCIQTTEIGLSLLLESTRIAEINAQHSSTAHAVVRVDKGQRVWVATNNAINFTCLFLVTTFSGSML